MASTYGARLNFRDASAATCKGLVHGSCWPDAEEPGVKDDLKGKGATREWGRRPLSYASCKSTLLGVTAPPARTFSSR